MSSTSKKRAKTNNGSSNEVKESLIKESHPPPPESTQNAQEKLAEGISKVQFDKLSQGELSISPNWITQSLVDRLRNDAKALYKSGAFTTGVLGGRSDNKYMEKNIRVCDCCGFFDDAAEAVGVGDESAREEVMDLISELREELLTRYNLAGFMELQYLRYPGDGGFYGKHVDQQGKNKGPNSNRIVSMLIYLNDDSWDVNLHGGMFRAYPKSKPMIEVAPTGGTLVLFNSKNLLHEAMPTHKERWALVGWFMEEDSSDGEAIGDSDRKKKNKKNKNKKRKGGH
jgi:hypothetical protein